MAFSEEKQAAVQAQLDSGRFTDDEVYKIVLDGAKKGYQFSVPVVPEAPAPVPSFVQEQPQMASMPEPAALPPEPMMSEVPGPDEQGVPIGSPIETYTGGFAPELMSAAPPAPPAPPMASMPGPDPVVGTAPVASLDPTVDGPTSVERVKYVEGTPEHGTSASNRRKGYMPPMNTAMRELYLLPGGGGQGVEPYIHMEPPVFRIWEDVPNMSPEAAADIEENGEDSDVVKEWRDAIWAQVSSTMAEHGEAAYRPQYMKADDLASAYGKFIGTAVEPSMSMFSSIDDAMTLGTVRQVMASVYEPSPAEQALVNRGVLPSAADRIKDTQSTSPGMGMLGSAISMLQTGGKTGATGATARLENWAFKKMKGEASKGLGRAGRVMGTAAAGAGLMESGEILVENLGRLHRGEMGPDIGDIGARFARSAIMGGLTGSATDLIGRGATWAGNRLRTSDTDLGRRINAIEPAESMKGQGGTSVIRGLETTPEHRRLLKEQEADLGTPLSARGPHDRLESQHKEALGKELDTLADRELAPVRAANEKFYNDVGAPRMSMVGLYKTLRRIADDKETVPFVKKELSRRLKDFEYKKKARGGGAALAPASTRGLLGESDRVEWGVPVKGEVPGIRRMNARELDEAIAGIDDLLAAGTAKGGKKSQALLEAQAELRNLYDSWGPATDGRKWSDVKAEHHQIRNRVEARAQRFGNRDIGVGGTRRYSDSMGETESNNLLNAVRASGTDANRYIKMLDDLKGNPALAKWLTEQRAITAKQGQVAELGGHISAPVMGDRKAASIASIGTEALVTRADAVATLLTQLNGRAGQTSRLTAAGSELGPMGAMEMQALASDGKLWTYGEAADLLRAAEAAQGEDE